MQTLFTIMLVLAVILALAVAIRINYFLSRHPLPDRDIRFTEKSIPEEWLDFAMRWHGTDHIFYSKSLGQWRFFDTNNRECRLLTSSVRSGILRVFEVTEEQEKFLRKK